MFEPGGAVDRRLACGETGYRLGDEVMLVGPTGPTRDHLERRRGELFGAAMERQ